MKLFLPFVLLALAFSLCNLGKPNAPANIRPLFNVVALADQGADAIDRALGAPEAAGLVRTYRLSDGSKADFQLVNNKPTQIITCLKSRAETPQQAMKYVGIEVGNTPPRSQNDQEALWRLPVDGKLLDIGVVSNSAMTLCSKDIVGATPKGSWVMVRIVPMGNK